MSLIIKYLFYNHQFKLAIHNYRRHENDDIKIVAGINVLKIKKILININ